jgi:hypothetical protein
LLRAWGSKDLFATFYTCEYITGSIYSIPGYRF